MQLFHIKITALVSLLVSLQSVTADFVKCKEQCRTFNGNNCDYDSYKSVKTLTPFKGPPSEFDVYHSFYNTIEFKTSISILSQVFSMELIGSPEADLVYKYTHPRMGSIYYYLNSREPNCIGSFPSEEFAHAINKIEVIDTASRTGQE
jgi:hypothetical protein